MTHFQKVFFLFGLLLSGVSLLNAAPFGIEFMGRKAERVQEKRVEKKLWDRPESSPLMEKSFPITKWNKHFSGLGSKRAPITMGEKKEKERFEVKILDRKTVSFEMSSWDKKMAELHKRAGIDMDKRAQLVADRKLYDMMLQDTRDYRDLAEEQLSLRDLNRFQFRRNRVADGVPVKKAASDAK